jgi:hypothetical protein
MIGMILTSYEDITFFIIHPILAAIVSTIFVIFSILVGQLNRIPVIGRFWHKSPLWASLLIACSLVALCFGSTFGLTEAFTYPHTDSQITGLHTFAAIAGYFCIIYAIAIGR